MLRKWGSACFSEIDRYTLEDAEVRLYYCLTLLDGTKETIPMGIYEISEAKQEGTDTGTERL